MPMDRRAALQLCCLLLLVPIQCLIMQYFGSEQLQMQYELNRLSKLAVYYKNALFSWDVWVKMCSSFLAKLSSMQQRRWGHAYIVGGKVDKSAQLEESPALEVLRFRTENGFFASSPVPRMPRPGNVKYRIGQVVQHQQWGYRAVVIGWDPVIRAPQTWLKEMRPKHRAEQRTVANYLLLVDVRDRRYAQKTYVAEENIDPLRHEKVIHPDINTYFVGFDGVQYLPGRQLKVVYPYN